jgi:hypothetical protein
VNLVVQGGLSYWIDNGPLKSALCNPFGHCELEPTPGTFNMVASKAGYQTVSLTRVGTWATGPNGPGCGDIVVFQGQETRIVLRPI